MITDIERLHDVVEGKFHYRGCGKTFARCHEVAGLIELGNETIICMVSFYRDWLYIKPMLEDVLYEHGIKITGVCTSRQEIFTDMARIKFIVENEVEEKSRGLEYGFVKMRHWD